ncbi:MAG TPA: ABC transporter substrate-binding protein [Paracoccus sp. (in: a-proteobacteria)]|nr:ABC transporter substrate-binding protein [Paracoccus sp. (in: a-proteobacteria)]
MKKALVLTTAMSVLCTAAGAQDVKSINVESWGGTYSKSEVEAYNKPFAAKTGIKVNMIDSDNPATPLKAQIEAGNVTSDVFDVEVSDAIRLCDEGKLVEIDPAILPPAPDGTPATEDFLPGTLLDCAVPNILWGTVIAYDTTKFPDNPPTTAADFFDLEKYPGKRGLPKSVKRTVYLALVADGVAPDKVFDELRTPEGVDRAFAKLDTIKKDVVWWEAGAQPVQLLADGEVVMTTVYNGRIFDAIVAEKKPFEVIWDGQFMDMNMFVIPRDAPHPEAAMEYVKFATATEQLAEQAKWISYGPSRKSSNPLIGKYNDGVTEMAPHMPTREEHMKTAVMDDPEFWADHDSELSERFATWLAN